MSFWPSLDELLLATLAWAAIEAVLAYRRAPATRKDDDDEI